MNKCQFCTINLSSAFMTKCCSCFICYQCKQKYQNLSEKGNSIGTHNNNTCRCGKSLANNNKVSFCVKKSKLYSIIQNSLSLKPKECDRCEKLAYVQCRQCKSVFCSNCNKQMHNAIGFSKHQRTPYTTKQKVQKDKTLKELNQTIITKNDIEICQKHKDLELNKICQCGQKLCEQCAKLHNESTSQLCEFKHPKIMNLKQFRQELYPKILSQVNRIKQYRSNLYDEKNKYQKHYLTEKQTFKQIQTLISDQLEGLKTILEIKIKEINSQMQQYWNQCQKVYEKTVYFIQQNLQKLDEFSCLAQKFTENDINQDYLERKIKRIQIPFNCCSFKLINHEHIQSQILKISVMSNKWQFNFYHSPLIDQATNQEQQRPSLKKSILKLSDNSKQSLNQPEDLIAYSKNPKQPRDLHLSATHQSIQYSFIALPFQNQTYQIEYGVGMKIKGQEIFKKIVNLNGKGVIQNLNASTIYRIRMKIEGGQWGQTKQIQTLDVPKFNLESNVFSLQTGQKSFKFIKSGAVYGKDPIYFGQYYWTVIIESDKSSYQESQTACISIGVSNKQQKKPIFSGSTLNYGYQKDILTVKVYLNCQEQTMSIQSQNNISQKFQNLPIFPIYPTVQNKSNNSVHIRYYFGKYD